MTWPGNDLWIPVVGLVVYLPREHYNPDDPHIGRPAVVIKVLRADRTCTVVTRTSSVEAVGPGDILHQADAALGCEKQGWWQPRRIYRVLFSAFDDEETQKYTKLDQDTLEKVIRAYEERP